MNFSRLSTALSYSSTALLVSAIAFSAVACGGATPAGQVPVSESQSLFVTGEGSVKAPSDRMRLSLGVGAKAVELDVAMQDATARVNALHAALLKSGISEQSIQTGHFSIHQIREQGPAPKMAIRTEAPQVEAAVVDESRPMPPGHPAEEWHDMYQVSTNFDVVLDDVNKAGEVIRAAVEAGANQGWGMNFELKDPQIHEDAAREKAVAEARRRAELMAKAAGVKVGQVLSISDVSSGGGGSMPKYAMADMRSANMTVAPGETEVTSTVQVVFAIER